MVFDVAILTEAGPTRGYGHLGRCCALYDALDVLGATPELLIRGEAPSHIVEDRSSRIVEWARADAVAELLVGADAAIVDSYEADAATYAAVQRAVGGAVYLDDTERMAYPPGILVAGSPAAAVVSFSGAAGVEVLAGPAFQPLRREFWDVPPRAGCRDSLERVLVVFGGTGFGGLRDSTVAALSTAYPDVEFDIVDAPRSAKEMRDSMLAADAAVTSAGQVLYELARTGAPAVAVAVADNQLGQVRAWDEAGAVVFAGSADDSDIIERLVRGLSTLSDSGVRTAMSHAGSALVDGQGARRVARALLGSVLRNRIRLVSATASDEDAVLQLANDPTIRANSLATSQISAETHHEWFAKRMADTAGTVMLLAWDGDALAGQVRFEIADDTANVSISIASQYRGLGWGRHLLQSAVCELGTVRPEVRTLVAHVRTENVASRRLFENAHFAPAESRSEDAEHVDALEYRRTVAVE